MVARKQRFLARLQDVEGVLARRTRTAAGRYVELRDGRLVQTV